ncbi:unnamed protein product, partial [Closterium sp. Naga37s-1]
ALKQVWDLSDEDKDGNLTLREFCTASYLIERYKSGRKLPPTLPRGFHVDEPVQDQRTAIAAKRLAEAQAALTQHSQGVNVPTWQRDPGVLVSPTKGAPRKDAAMDQKKKAVFFRDKMQEIVMFKSRCDLRLADVSEQADVEKKEMEELARKYDDKYKAAQLSAGKLAAEERALQQMQEKAHIIMNATSRLDRGGDPNQLLQDKADRLALEVEEMRKAVFAHATAIGLKVRPLVGSETPFGWQANLQEKATDWDDEWDDVQFEGLVVVRDIGDTPLAENEDPFPRPKSKEQEEKGGAGASAAAETGKGEGEEGKGEGDLEDGKGGEGMTADGVDGAANTGGEGPGDAKENEEKEKQEKEEEKKRKKKEKSMGSVPSGPSDFFSPEEDEDADSNEAMIGMQRHGEGDEDEEEEEEEEVEEIVMDSTPILQITAGGEGGGGGRGGSKDGMMEGVVAGGAGGETKQGEPAEAGVGGKEGEREEQEIDGETSAVQEESAASASPGDSKEILGFPFQGWSRGSAGKAGAAGSRAGGAGGRGSGGAVMPSLADLASSFSLSPTSGVSPVSPVSAAASTSSRASTTASPFNPASVAKSLAAANAAAAAINAASGTPDSTPAGVAAGGTAAASSAGKSPPSATSVRRTLDLDSVDSPQQDSTASGASSTGGLGFGSVMTAGPGGRYGEGAGIGAGAVAGGGGGGRDGYGEGDEVSRPYTAHGLVSEDMVESDAESDSGRKGYGSRGRGRDEEEDEQAADSTDTAAPAAGIPAAATAAAAAASAAATAATAAPSAAFGLSPSADSEGGAVVTETKSGSFAFDFSAEPEDPFGSGAAAAADPSESASPFPASFSTEGRRRSGNDEVQSPLTHAAVGLIHEDSPIHSGLHQQQLRGAADTFDSSPFHANPVVAAPFDASQFDQGFGRDSSFGRDPSFSRDSSFKGYRGSIFDSATGAASFKGGIDASAFDSATGAASFKGGSDASAFDQHYGGVGAFDQHYGAGGAALDTSSSFRSSVDSPSGSHARSGEFHPGQFQSFASGFDDHFDSNPYGASAGTMAGGGGGRGRGEEEEEVHSSEEEDSGGDPFASLRSSGGVGGGNQHVTASHFDAYNYDKASEETETPGAARQGGVQPGSASAFDSYCYGPRRVVAVSAPARVKEVVLLRPHHSGRGLLFARGNHWAGLRSALTPIFHRSTHLHSSFPGMHRSILHMLLLPLTVGAARERHRELMLEWKLLLPLALSPACLHPWVHALLGVLPGSTVGAARERHRELMLGWKVRGLRQHLDTKVLSAVPRDTTLLVCPWVHALLGVLPESTVANSASKEAAAAFEAPQKFYFPQLSPHSPYLRRLNSFETSQNYFPQPSPHSPYLRRLNSFETSQNYFPQLSPHSPYLRRLNSFETSQNYFPHLSPHSPYLRRLNSFETSQNYFPQLSPHSPYIRRLNNSHLTFPISPFQLLPFSPAIAGSKEAATVARQHFPPNPAFDPSGEMGGIHPSLHCVTLCVSLLCPAPSHQRMLEAKRQQQSQGNSNAADILKGVRCGHHIVHAGLTVTFCNVLVAPFSRYFHCRLPCSFRDKATRTGLLESDLPLGTTSSTLAFAVHMLTQHPEVVGKLQAEIDRCFEEREREGEGKEEREGKGEGEEEGEGKEEREGKGEGEGEGEEEGEEEGEGKGEREGGEMG